MDLDEEDDVDSESLDAISERAGFISVSKVAADAFARVERTYANLVTSLTIGNAGASVAVLGFIGATWANGNFYRPALVPLVLFFLGTACMAIGALAALLRDLKCLGRLSQRPTGRAPQFYRQADLPSPVENLGLSFSNAATIGAILSAFFFVAGCVAGFVILAS